MNRLVGGHEQCWEIAVAVWMCRKLDFAALRVCSLTQQPRINIHLCFVKFGNSVHAHHRFFHPSLLKLLILPTPTALVV